jgi:uncharacterized protein YcbX
MPGVSMPAGEVGRVAALWRYPVKSMAGQALDAADVGWHGLAGDRRWAFVQEKLIRSDFPWLTMRERSDLGQYRPVLADDSRPDRSPTVVRTPAGEELDIADPALAAALGDGIRLIKLNRGTFDVAPLSLISVQTIEALGGMAEVAIDQRRFRPNLVVDAAAPFAEDDWVGATLRLGGARMRVDQRDERCVMVNIDPDTGVRDPRVLRTIAQQRGVCLGVYGAPVEPGRVAVGDPVVLER